MLVRLDSARARLSAHHSAPGRGMLRRGGGGGGFGGGGNVQAARQLLLSLLDGTFVGGGQQSRRGQGGVGGNGRHGPGARQREGEWACQCGFGTNRAYREACHQCGRSRDVAEVKGNAGSKGNGDRRMADGKGQKSRHSFTASGGGFAGKGPVGAGGTRPLLGGRGRSPLGGAVGGVQCKGAASAPIWDGKGPPLSSAASRTGGGTKADDGKGGKGKTGGDVGGKGTPTAVDRHGGPRSPWTRPPTIVDDEGYELVQRRKVRSSNGGPKGEAHTPVHNGDDCWCDGDGCAAKVVRR